MAFEPIHCPTCHGVDVVKYGKTSDGKQRFRCQNVQCECATFIRDYIYQGLLPEVKHQIIEMSLNGSGHMCPLKPLPLNYRDLRPRQ
jgi:insertion element IS1 protein InsB